MSTKTNNCSAHRNNEINDRIYNRNIPSQILQPYLNIRPVMTKYSIMPIVDPRKENKVRAEQMPVYNTQTIFNPGNTKSPWSGYDVNQESDLKNQIFALQKCSQASYVPSSNSDLYKWTFNPSYKVTQTHDLLFKEEKFTPFDPNPEKIGHGLFHNSTRTQIKDLTQEC